MSYSNIMLFFLVPYEYGHVVLFIWDPDEQKPFRLFPKDAVPEIPDYCYDRKLSVEGRRKTFMCAALPNCDVSLFVKVEKG